MSSPRRRKATPTATPRGKSAIDVASYDLDTAIQVARLIRDSGLTPVPLTTLARAVAPGTNPNTFRNKVYTAAKYGLLALAAATAAGAGEVVTLPLLEALDDPSREQESRVTTFLNIALHRAVVERYRDQLVPPDPEVQRILVAEFGVSGGQAADVRRVLLRSLHQAGLIGVDRRLTAPQALDAPNNDHPVAQQTTAVETVRFASADAPPQRGETAARVTEMALPPISIPLGQVPLTVLAWLARMPAEDTPWPEEQRASWHAAFRAMTDAIYRNG